MSLKAISPIDGRYASKTAILGESLSEYALMKYRSLIEIRWLLHLSNCDAIPELRLFTQQERSFLEKLAASFDEPSAERIKSNSN